MVLQDNIEKLDIELRQFIIGYCRAYKIGDIDEDSIDLDTSLDLDLDIYDIEIDLFLAEFAETFRIDNSRFTWYKYGYPKGSVGVSILKKLFGYRSPWVRRVARRMYKPRFKVLHLQQALRCGRLL